MRRDRSWLATVPPYVWLLVLFLFPFLLVLKLSLSDVALAIPPYRPTFDPAHPAAVLKGFDGQNYRRLISDTLYISAYLSSLRLAAVATILLLLVGYPLAYGISRCGAGSKELLVLLVTLPFFTSFLIRIYAWIAILKPAGLLNAALGVLHIPPLSILNTDVAVLIGLVYAYLPFMVLPLYAVLEKQDEALIEASADLGATPFQSFWRITFPMSVPGAAAGALLCFIPMVGEFVIPDLLGGSRTLMIGKTIWTEFFANRDWPSASAAAIVLLLTLIAPIVLYQRQQAKGLPR